MNNSYSRLTTLPLYNLLFVLPLVCIYETMTQFDVKSGLSAWCDYYNVPVLLPCIVLLGLLVLDQLVNVNRNGYGWLVDCRVLVGMAGECVLYTLMLFAFALLLDILRQTLYINITIKYGWIDYLGAGIYEELIFRMLLLAPLYDAFKRVTTHKVSCILGVIVSSLLFALMHKITSPYQFSFLLVGGLFFGTLYLKRGFGIAVGTHALYDILVGCILT